MRKLSLMVLFSTVFVGLAVAGTEAADSQLAGALPQPMTVLICTAGLAFLRCFGGHLKHR